MVRTFKQFKSRAAIYTPALSPAFVKPLSNIKNKDLADEFNWLNNKSKWHYKWGLYSAGHAYLDIDTSDIKESFIQNRDREHSLIIGDSGGFQIATGVMKFDWANEDNITDMTLDANKQRMKLLRWLEHTSDIATTLDWPTWMFDDNDNKFGRGKNTQLKNRQHCIDGTLRNLEFFKRHRENDNVRLLNVIQGGDNQEVIDWYNIVKKYKFEGWALGGTAKFKIGETLMRFITMRDEYMFEDGADWIHFLGISKLTAGLSLTALQNTMRKHINDKIQISYDSASPFLMAAFGSVYRGSNISNSNLSMHTSRVYKGDKLFNNNNMWPVDSPVNNMYNIGEFADINAKHKWLLRGYLKLMYDNTYQLCSALDQATDIYLDAPIAFKNQHIPKNVLEMEQIFDDIFQSDAPDSILKDPHINNILNNSINEYKNEFKIYNKSNNLVFDDFDLDSFRIMREKSDDKTTLKFKINENIVSSLFD